MHRWLLFLFSALLCVAASDSPGSKDVLAAVDAWKQATLSKDKGALDKLLHEDLTYSHSNGRTETKADVLNGLAKNNATSIEFASPQSVRVYGNTALVKGNGKFTSMTDGKPTVLELSVLQVWMKGPGGWRLVARQSTRLNP